MSQLYGAYFLCLLILCGCLILLHLQHFNFANDLTINVPLNHRIVKEIVSTTTQFYDIKSLAENRQISYNGNTSCVERKVSLSEIALPLTGLISFPGSGNTWTRHLIQQMTGIGTSSVYCDKKLKKAGFPFECSHELFNRTIVIKSHRPKDISRFTKIILLIRNPYDALLSYSKFRLSGHVKHPSIEKLKTEIDNNSAQLLERYAAIVTEITKHFKGPVYVLQYENLKSNMLDELTKLSKFLKTNQTYNDLRCTVKLQEGNFHRNTSDQEHIKLLKLLYQNSILLKIQEKAKFVEDEIKKAYDLDIDLRGLEYKLFETEIQ